ncbi:DUF624 domain-containing protein [Lachnospiraceae bacterium C1.1]|nr:DUF624 domain-containing protein [Lachnospiraceae bacterium C1.1]
MNIFKKFNDWYMGNNERETEPPRSGLPRIAYLLINYTGRIVAVNMLFLLCSIPLITAPAALMALNRYLIKMYRDGYAFDMEDYFKEFKSELFRALPLGLISLSLTFYGYYLASLALNYAGSEISMILTVIGSAFIINGLLFSAYAFVMGAMLDLNLAGIIRNSFLFILIEWRSNVKIALTYIVFLFLTLTFLPFSFIPLLLFAFSLLQLFIISAVNRSVEKRILSIFKTSGT